MKGIPDEACSILLTHDPWHWRSEVVFRTNIPFTLAGHTHAWQMQIGSFSPAQWLMPEWGGLYHLGDQQLYVSTGIGGKCLTASEPGQLSKCSPLCSFLTLNSLGSHPYGQKQQPPQADVQLAGVVCLLSLMSKGYVLCVRTT